MFYIETSIIVAGIVLVVFMILTYKLITRNGEK